MAKLTFKTDLCKGCGLCVDVCPKKVLRLASEKINKKGHHPVEAANESACILRNDVSRLHYNDRKGVIPWLKRFL